MLSKAGLKVLIFCEMDKRFAEKPLIFIIYSHFAGFDSTWTLYTTGLFITQEHEAFIYSPNCLTGNVK